MLRHARSTILAACAVGLTSASSAFATNITEFPDNGSEQLARGGAWVARASNPLASFYNPAGLAGQDTRLILQANMAFQNTCFTRLKAANDQTNDGIDPGAKYPTVCNNPGTLPNPQLALTLKVTDRVGVGIAVLAPSGVGNVTWPEFVDGPNGSGKVAAPQRYLLTSGNAFFLTPTIGVGVRVLDSLRVGASLQWGIATLQFSNASDATNTNGATPADNDVKALLLAKDYFVPGFTLGALWSPATMVDVAGWFKWSAPIEASADVAAYANYYRPAVAQGGLDNKVSFTYTKDADCAWGRPAGECGPDKGTVKVPVPMEAKVGVRVHRPVAGADPKRRDPLSQDKWDLEADFTFANNQNFDALQIRFPDAGDGSGAIHINGTGGTLPPNADVTKGFKNVFGVRLGGDWNILPDRFALRAGGFFETDGQQAQYQSIDFIGAARVGLAAGAVYRQRFGGEKKTSALEISAGFMHMFVLDQSINDPNAPGLPALAGAACNPPSPTVRACTSGTQPYRTNWAVNLGTITNALNVLNVGLAYRF